jgi:hypothetical protein
MTPSPLCSIDAPGKNGLFFTRAPDYSQLRAQVFVRARHPPPPPPAISAFKQHIMSLHLHHHAWLVKFTKKRNLSRIFFLLTVFIDWQN